MRFPWAKNKRVGLFRAPLRFGASLRYALARSSPPLQSLTQLRAEHSQIINSNH